MHTVAYKSCRIHYNADFSGNVIITNQDDTSTPISQEAIITYSLKDLIRNLEIQQRLFPEGIPGSGTITIKSNEEGYDKEIEILHSDVELFVKDILIDKIKEELETGDTSLGNLKTIAGILNIKLLKE